MPPRVNTAHFYPSTHLRVCSASELFSSEWAPDYLIQLPGVSALWISANRVHMVPKPEALVTRETQSSWGAITVWR